jgi:gliding motility-associated-like protein
MDTAIRTNYIGVAEPVVNFSANPDNGCLSLTTTFIDSTTDLNVATITSRRWDFGDGSPNSTAASPTHVYSLTGDFSVKLVAVDNVGCTDSFTRAAYVHVHKPGAAFFASPVNACPGTPVNFINTSSGIPVTSYWDFGDGTTSTDNSPLHYYANTGTYTVKLYILDTLGCRDTITKTSYIRITAKPHAKFGIDDTFSICTPLVVNFSDSSTGAVSYLWDFGDPLAAPSIIRSPGWTYKYPGIYHIYEVVTNAAGCTDTAWGTVYILGYRGAFSYTPLVGCSPLTVDFRVLVHGVPDFIYDFDDGNTKKTTDTTYVHTYTQIGAHVPKLIMTDDNGCSSESIGLDTILVDGVYEGFVAEPQPLCDSGTVELFDTSHGAFSAIVSHKWIFHDGTTANVRIPKHTYHGPGTYSVILIDSTNTSCVDTLNSSITFWPLPDIDAGPDTTICLNDHAVLNPTGGVVYVWSPGASLSCDTCIHPDATPAVATVYKVIGTDIHGCKNSDTVEVFIKTKTTSIARGSGEICDGEYIQLNDSAGYNSVYDWVPDYKLSDPHASDPIASPDTTTLYIAVAKQAGCIADSQYVNVIVHPRPDVSLGPDQIMIAGNTVQLNAVGSNLDTLAWRPAGSLTCDDCMSPIADPKQTTTYYVIVHTIYNCYDSADVTIKVICDKSQVYMPNTFTPNGDGQNDVFYPHGKGLRIIKSFKIYDRWGQIIFEHDNFNTNQKENGWDGTFKGAPLSPDVFVYLLDAICDTGEPMQWKGDVSLIR